MDCPALLSWNCHNHTCARLRHSECCPQDSSVSFLGFDVPCFNGEKMGDPNNCNTYNLCENGKYVKYYCPSGQRWCPILRRCRTAYMGPCATTTPAPTTPTTTPTTTVSGPTTTPGTTTTAIPCSNIQIADPFDCTKYYQCQNGKLTHQSCASGYYWNCWSRKCSTTKSPLCCVSMPYSPRKCSTNGVLNGSPLSCTNYFECVNNVVVKKSCPYNQFFDTITKTCTTPMTARCSIKPAMTVCSLANTGNLDWVSASYNITFICPKW